MTKRQEDKLNMYDSVLMQYNQNETSFDTMVALQNAYAALKTVVAAINSTSQQQLPSAKGHTINKADKKNSISNFGNEVAGALYAWAIDQKDLVLKEKVKTTYSALFTMRDEELANLCRTYYGIAAANQLVLTDYGLTKEVVDSFKMAIDNYQTTVPAPRNAVAQRKAYRAKLASLFKEADTILKSKVDKLSLPLKKTNPDYLETYLVNRRIVNSATNSTALRIIVTDAITSEPINDVAIQIEALALQRVTDKQGQVTIKPIPQGVYQIKLHKEGYLPQTIAEQKATLGKTSITNVLLKRVL